MDWVWAFLIAVITMIALDQPVFSIDRVLIGSRSLSYAEMAILKLVVGALTFLLILALCCVFMRRPPSKGMIWGALITQVLWLEIEWGFTVSVSSLGELCIRLAEEAGALTLAVAALGVTRLWMSGRSATPSP